MTTRHRLFARLLICALLVLPLTSFPLRAFAGNNISVQVVCKPGVGVANAEVKIYRISATDQSTNLVRGDRTNKRGVANINNLDGGAYELVVVCPGGETFTHQFRIGGGVDESHAYVFRCCPWPPGAPPNGGDGLIAIDGKAVTDDVTAGSRGTSNVKVSTTNQGGLQTVTFDTLEGRVKVNLPDDMRFGDTISGTVVCEPKGQTDDERAKNMSPMSDRKIRIAANKPDGTSDANVEVPITASPSPFTITLPPNKPPSPTLTNVSRSNSGGLGITLTNTSASLTTGPTQTVPIELVSLSLTSVAPITVHQLPTIGQQGRPIEIIRSGVNNQNPTLNWTKVRSTVQDFEKNTENVSGGFGLIDGNPVCASPRKAVFIAPTNVTGPIEITLKEGDKETKGTYRNVGVNLSTPTTSLVRNQRTTVKIEVRLGTPKITEPVQGTITCEGVITMEGGNYQQLVIQPSQVDEKGNYLTTREVTGVQTGVWGATVTVVTQPFNIVLRDPSPPRTILINSFTGDYAFCGSGFKLNGTGQIKRQGCVITLTDNKPDRQVQGTFDGCVPVDNGRFSVFNTAGTATDIKVTVTDTNPKKTKVYFNPLSRPAPPVQDVSAFATCP